MKKFAAIILMFFAFNGFSQKNTALPSAFYSPCWASSFEEDQGATQVYRSCSNRSLGPGHRLRYIFKNDGTCQVLLVDETGGSYYRDCKWTYNQPTGVVTISDATSVYAAKFEVLSVDDQALKVKVIN